jgi:hypothetical protein
MLEEIVAFIICGLFAFACICLAIYLFVEVIEKFIE